MTEQVDIAVIGGTGLYAMPEISERSSVRLTTPWGDPSADIVIGTLRGKRVAFLPRHGPGHRLSPFRSSLPRQHLRPQIPRRPLRHLRQRLRFPARGLSPRPSGHPRPALRPHPRPARPHLLRARTSWPTSPSPSPSVIPCARSWRAQSPPPTLPSTPAAPSLIIEGPRFSTRGESHIFRQWGCSIIGMTTCPEAFLAREAEMSYASLAHVTDYDVWKEEPRNRRAGRRPHATESAQGPALPSPPPWTSWVPTLPARPTPPSIPPSWPDATRSPPLSWRNSALSSPVASPEQQPPAPLTAARVTQPLHPLRRRAVQMYQRRARPAQLPRAPQRVQKILRLIRERPHQLQRPPVLHT